MHAEMCSTTCRPIRDISTGLRAAGRTGKPIRDISTGLRVGGSRGYCTRTILTMLVSFFRRELWSRRIRAVSTGEGVSGA
eukprot:3269185-Rhodomonas_salina.6